jgi:hypothetical protein
MPNNIPGKGSLTILLAGKREGLQAVRGCGYPACPKHQDTKEAHQGTFLNPT